MTDTDRRYVRRRPGLSWHVVRTHTRLEDGWIALCGKRIIMDDAAALDTLPGAKSCESCLRIFVRGVDPVPEDDAATSPVDPS